MTLHPLLLAAWSFCLAMFIVLAIYKGHLTRHEVDTVFLNDDIVDQRETEHAALLRRVSQIEPFLRTAAGAALLMTLAVVGIYVAKILPTVHF